MDFIEVWPHESVSAAWAAWTQGMADALGWALLISLLFLVPLVVLFSGAVRRHRFWCALRGRQVEVVLEERGLPGFRHAVGVRSCSVFDPPTAVTCRRRCLDADCRRQWEPALPIHVLAGDPGALGDR